MLIFINFINSPFYGEDLLRFSHIPCWWNRNFPLHWVLNACAALEFQGESKVRKSSIKWHLPWVIIKALKQPLSLADARLANSIISPYLAVNNSSCISIAQSVDLALTITKRCLKSIRKSFPCPIHSDSIGNWTLMELRKKAIA